MTKKLNWIAVGVLGALVIAGLVMSQLVRRDLSTACLLSELESNWTVALQVCQKPADEGNATAQQVLGRIYLQGSGVARDLNKAGEYLQKAFNQGHPRARPLIGKLYTTKDYVGFDPEYGRMLLMEEVAKCHVESMVYLAIAYSGENAGLGNDPVESLKWLLVGKTMITNAVN